MTPLEFPSLVTKRITSPKPGTIVLPEKRDKTGFNQLYHSIMQQTNIGRYEIIYPIAAGGMASVYAGRLSGMAGFERLFAIKVIHPHLAAHRGFIEMFLDEARLAGRIHHPNVAEIFEVGEDNGIYYMVGELVLGQDLRRLTEAAEKKETLIPRTVVAHIIAGIANGLHEAHELKDEDGELSHLVHRDVSTQNILISYQGYTKLIDFGVAWARGRLSYTRDGSQKGKIGYMPPEQLRGEAIDRRCDIYALGVVLYTALLRTHPFPYDNEGEQVAKMLAGDFAKPRSVDPSLDAELENIILTAMANDPNDRFDTAAAMGIALLAYVKKHQRNGDPARQLAELMQGLFHDDIIEHEKKIRNHRKQANAQERGTPIPVPAQNRYRDRARSLSENTEIVGTVSTDIVEDNTRFSNKFTLIRQNRVRMTILAAVLGAMTLVYLFVFRAEPGIPPTRVRLPLAAAPKASEQIVSRVMADARTSSPEKILPKQITIQVEGIVPTSRAFLNDIPSHFPIKMPISGTPVRLKIETPGFETFETAITPDKDKTVLISLTKTAAEEKLDKSPGHPTKTTKKTDSRAKKARRSEAAGTAGDWEKNPFL